MVKWWLAEVMSSTPVVSTNLGVCKVCVEEVERRIGLTTASPVTISAGCPRGLVPDEREI